MIASLRNALRLIGHPRGDTLGASTSTRALKNRRIETRARIPVPIEPVSAFLASSSVNFHFTRQCNYSCKFCFHSATSEGCALGYPKDCLGGSDPAVPTRRPHSCMQHCFARRDASRRHTFARSRSGKDQFCRRRADALQGLRQSAPTACPRPRDVYVYYHERFAPQARMGGGECPLSWHARAVV